MNLAPIAFFAYKRPTHTEKALTALAECELAAQSRLFVFCDGPRTNDDLDKISQVREIAESRKWCGEVVVINQDENTGLAGSVMGGVSRLCDEFGKAIVIEDDLIVSQGFLSYMNRALDRYVDNPQVMQISGHCFPFSHSNRPDSAFFMPISTSWGWATWKRAWNFFDPDAGGYQDLATDGPLRQRFDLDGISPYSMMLFDQMSGKLDSWAIRWWWSFFRNNGLCLYPGKSLVKNIGFGEGASHTTRNESYHDDPQWSPDRTVTSMPDVVAADMEAFASLKSYLKQHIPHEDGLTKTLKRVARLLGLGGGRKVVI